LGAIPFIFGLGFTLHTVILGIVSMIEALHGNASSWILATRSKMADRGGKRGSGRDKLVLRSAHAGPAPTQK
jgi:hypothetical protein